MPLGGGLPPLPVICVELCRATSLNSMRLTFSLPVQMEDRSGSNDALNVDNYDVTAVVPPDAFVPFIQWIEPVDEFTVEIYFDNELQPDVLYRIQALNVATAWPDCQTLDPACSACEFTSLIPERPADAIRRNDEERMDLSNPQVVEDRKQADGPLGSFQINNQGDFALEDNPSYLRKRILRRATTGVGEFFHLPGYGFGTPLKGLLTPGALRRIQAAAVRQIRQEPDVRAANVRVRQASAATPNVVVLDIRVITTDGRTEAFTAPIDYGSS